MPLYAGQLACPACGALVHRRTLESLAAEAQQYEETDPARAADVWRRALALLPPDAQQARMIAARADVLAPPPAGPPPVLEYGPPPPAEQRGETWQSALLKTGGSMALSVYLYSSMPGGWRFAVGLVLLIFVHEMGHVVANWHYGIRQSAPIFLGIFGAVIFLRGDLRNAREEAVSGIAGPVFGTVAALACFGWYLRTGSPLARDLSFYGFFLNLWNLMPVPPLDGGRTTAAVTPWLWVAGLAGLAMFELWVLYTAWGSSRGVSFAGLFIIFWILSQSLPRIRRTLLGGEWRSHYYRIGWRPRLGITATYVGLIVVLVGCLGWLVQSDGVVL